jgi:outer membrane protein OmpA-like peptidoglycan-associated protein
MRLRLYHCVLVWCWWIPLFGQGQEPDAPGCVDSKIVPKLLGCRIDNCENKHSDHRDVVTREDEKGDAVTSAVEGESRSLMYECREGTTPDGIVQQAIAVLKAAQFEIPYQFADKEGAITARKGDLWVLVEAASRYYTLVELKAAPSDESAIDAADMAEAIERHGHVAIYGVEFPPGRSDIVPECVPMLREIAAMLEDNPEWRIRVEGHTDSAGTKLANVTLSQRRSAAVVAWLVGRGIKRVRLESAGLGDAQPLTDNDTEVSRSKNRRIELVKIESTSPQ